jgi:hypothetical protein
VLRLWPRFGAFSADSVVSNGFALLCAAFAPSCGHDDLRSRHRFWVVL